MKAFVLFFCLVLSWGGRGLAAEPLADRKLRSEISRLLEWTVFWRGPQSLGHYHPGAIVNSTVVSSDGELAVFIEEIRAIVYLTVDKGEVVDRQIGGMLRPTIAESIEAYVSEKQGVPGFVLKRGAPKQPVGTPLWIPEPNKVKFKRASVRLRLPTLVPPRCIRFRERPSDANAVLAVARSAIGDYLGLTCAQGTANIPFFSVADPIVYVYVDLGKVCGTGVLPIRMGRRGYKAGMFSADRRPNDWSYTINQIQTNTMLQLRVQQSAH